MEYKNFNKETDWMAVDFDGTLHIRPRDKNLTELGEPIWPMIELIKMWLEEGMTVKIFTARVSPVQNPIHGPVDINKQRKIIEDWCEKYLGQKLEITCFKDGYTYQLYDDRAVCIEHNTGVILGINESW